MAIPFVTIELDKTRHLRLTQKSVVEYEQITGKRILDMDEVDFDTLNVDRYILAMLKHEEPDIKLEKVQSLIDDYEGGFVGLMKEAGKALNVFLYGKIEAPNAEKPTAASKKPIG